MLEGGEGERGGAGGEEERLIPIEVSKHEPYELNSPLFGPMVGGIIRSSVQILVFPREAHAGHKNPTRSSFFSNNIHARCHGLITVFLLHSLHYDIFISEDLNSEPAIQEKLGLLEGKKIRSQVHFNS